MTCPAAVGGQAEQRSARVKRGEGGRLECRRALVGSPRSADLHRRAAEQIRSTVEHNGQMD